MSDLWGTSGSAPEPSDADSVPPAGPTPARPEQPADRAEPAPGLAKPRLDKPKREPEPLPEWLRSTPDRDTAPPPGRDPVAVAAVICGFAGIVVAGILMAIVTAVLAGQAGIRARESGRTYELPYLAFLLAFVDGAVWIALHLLLYVPAWIG